MIVFLDTNVVVDVLSQREGFAASKTVMELCEAEAVRGYITTSSITDIVYILRRYMSHKAAKQRTEELLEVFRLAVVESSDIVEAFDHAISDYEDAVFALCAARHGADVIVTNNIKDFKHATLPVMTPGEFLMQMAGAN